jgi:DNA-binding FadR family transcriptional regulator
LPNPLPTAPTRPLYTRLAEAPTVDLTTGRRGIGTPLPTEHERFSLHGVSRATVREAFDRFRRKD